MNKFYKTIFTFKVLSEEPIPDNTSLADIEMMTMDGDWVGQFGETIQQELTPKQAADALYEFGSEPGFFQLDDNGDAV